MKQIILDIEANGLRPDTIWCIVAKEEEYGTECLYWRRYF